MFVDERSEFLFVTRSTQYHACNKASQFDQPDCCLYALCDECFQNKFPKTRRGGSSRDKGEKSPIEVSRRTCCHNKQDLVAREDMWWCEPTKIGSKTWFTRAHACFACAKAFVQVPEGCNLLPKPPKDFKQFPPVKEYHKEVQDAYKKHNNLACNGDLKDEMQMEWPVALRFSSGLLGERCSFGFGPGGAAFGLARRCSIRPGPAAFNPAQGQLGSARGRPGGHSLWSRGG